MLKNDKTLYQNSMTFICTSNIFYSLYINYNFLIYYQQFKSQWIQNENSQFVIIEQCMQ